MVPYIPGHKVARYYGIMVLWYYGIMVLWYYGIMVLWYYVHQKTPKNNSSYNYTGHYYSFFCSPAFCVIYLVTIPFFQ
jgi:hypothetical protein